MTSDFELGCISKLSNLYTLNIAPVSNDNNDSNNGTDNKSLVNTYYSNHGTFNEGDSGLDLFCMNQVTVPAGARGYSIGLGIRGQMTQRIVHHLGARKLYETVRKSYFLLPRSSISNTPLRLSNSVGLIDSGYTGELIAKVDNLSDTEYTVSKGTRLFQVVLPNLEPFSFTIVDKLVETQRGNGGFGSTTPIDTVVGVAPMFGVCQ